MQTDLNESGNFTGDDVSDDSLLDFHRSRSKMISSRIEELWSRFSISPKNQR